MHSTMSNEQFTRKRVSVRGHVGLADRDKDEEKPEDGGTPVQELFEVIPRYCKNCNVGAEYTSSLVRLSNLQCVIRHYCEHARPESGCEYAFVEERQQMLEVTDGFVRNMLACSSQDGDDEVGEHTESKCGRMKAFIEREKLYNSCIEQIGPCGDCAKHGKAGQTTEFTRLERVVKAEQEDQSGWTLVAAYAEEAEEMEKVW